MSKMNLRKRFQKFALAMGFLVSLINLQALGAQTSHEHVRFRERQDYSKLRCQQSNQCPGTLSCLDGACQRDDGRECVIDNDCRPEKTCDGRYCVAKRSGSCSSSIDCDSLERCELHYIGNKSYGTCVPEPLNSSNEVPAKPNPQDAYEVCIKAVQLLKVDEVTRSEFLETCKLLLKSH